MAESEWEIPNDEGVDPVDVKPEADLQGADLSDANLPGANLRKADLSGADLREADLSSAYIPKADLSDTDLHDVNFAEADLSATDLSQANISVANLSNSSLLNANLSNADLSGADLSGANLNRSNLDGAILWDASLSNVLISRETTFSRPQRQIEEKLERKDGETPLSVPTERWDAIARVNHELRAVYSENGLISRAREARVRERRARRKEARHDETRWGTAAAAGSLISRWTTGYGVKLIPVAIVMMLLFAISTAVYWNTGMSIAESLYYSAVTFTTSPPSDPNPGLMRLVAGVETFLGTTMIVFLGYVLGAREQV